MKEDYLHLLWSQKRLPFHRMKLVDGKEFAVKNSGTHNKGSGPDFFDGEIEIESIIWRGNIEIHVKSSDWYLHGHHFDKSYDNVVLHVVYEDDKPVYIQNRLVPTLELKGFIEKKHRELYENGVLYEEDFTCANSLKYIDTIYLESMKERALVERLNRKIAFFDVYKLDSYHQLLYELIGGSFGMKVNSIPFMQLTKTVPLKVLKKEDNEAILAILIGASGISFPHSQMKMSKDWSFFREKYGITAIFKEAWKKKGVRPSGFPLVRIHQFAELISKFDFTSNFSKLNAMQMISFFYTLLNFDKTIENVGSLTVSQKIKDTIISNSFVVFIWWYGKEKNDILLLNKALQILSILDSESNNVLKKWNVIGGKNKKAYDSQALLEIYNEYCCKKRCLSCVVGTKILNI
jgi:hypothetical protein